MKKVLLVSIAILGFGSVAHAAPTQTFLSGDVYGPAINTAGVTRCLQITAGGLFQTANSACGTGGGGGGGGGLNVSTSSNPQPAGSTLYMDTANSTSTAISTSTIFISQTGNNYVGISTTSPDAILDVQGVGSATNKELLHLDYYATSGNDPSLRLRKARNVPGAAVAVTAGDNLGSIYFQGWDGGVFRNAALINIITPANPTKGLTVQGKINIATYNSLGQANIGLNGTQFDTWGIGTTSPYATLSVVGNSGVVADKYFATSTTATSTFMGNVRIGTACFNGNFPPTGFFNTNATPQMSICQNVADATSLLTLGNMDTGPFSIGTITFVNANTPSSGGISSTYNANIGFSGPNFAAFTGLPPNAFVIDNTDGPTIYGSLASTTATGWQAWAVGTGYSAGNYDMALKMLDPAYMGTGSAGLGIGSTTPTAALSITASTTASYPYLAFDKKDTTNLSTPNVSMLKMLNNGNFGLSSSTPGTTLSLGTSNGVNIPSSGTSTFNGINVRNDCIGINSSCVGTKSYPSFGYATSTWTGTTTLPLMVAYIGQTFNGIKCSVQPNGATVNVQVYNVTSKLDMVPASSTIGTTLFTSNNGFAVNATSSVDVGTPVSSPTSVTCTVLRTLNSW